jgi:hypothetical protein
VTKARSELATDLSADSGRAQVAARIAARTGATLDFFCAVPTSVADEYGVDLVRARDDVAAADSTADRQDLDLRLLRCTVCAARGRLRRAEGFEAAFARQVRDARPGDPVGERDPARCRHPAGA